MRAGELLEMGVREPESVCTESGGGQSTEHPRVCMEVFDSGQKADRQCDFSLFHPWGKEVSRVRILKCHDA